MAIGSKCIGPKTTAAVLAAQAKLRDGFGYQICVLNLEAISGRIGRGFAEAHHKVGLATLKQGVVKRVKDLITVCANCHRTLHRMRGARSDVPMLRRAVRQHR